jgi:hypothetical protein
MHAELVHSSGNIAAGIHQLHSHHNGTRFDVASVPSQGVIMQI